MSKFREKLRAGVLLHQDNMPIHTAQVTAAEPANCSFQLLPYPPYSPALAPSDFFLFSKLKSHLHGCCFGNNDEIICAVKGFLEDQDITFCDGIVMLNNCWNKCIDVKGADYIDK